MISDFDHATPPMPPRWRLLIETPWAPVVAGFSIVLLAVLPLLVFGQHAVVQIHDYLDSNFVEAALLGRYKLIFAAPDTIVPLFMGGIARRFLESAWSPYLWAFAVLSPYQALVAGEMLTRGLAFTGMYLWARDLTGGNRAAAVCAAAGFAVVAFFPSLGGSIAALPLLAWTVKRIRLDGFTVARVLLLAVYVLCSWLPFTGLFAIAAIGLVAVIDAVRRDPVRCLRLMGVAAIVGVLFILKDFNLLGAAKEFTSRNLMKGDSLSTAAGISWGLHSLSGGTYHAPVALKFVITPAIVLATVSVFAREGRAALSDIALRRLALTIAAMIATVVAATVAQNDAFVAAWDRTSLPYVNFSRFQFLQPALALTMFALALDIIWRRWGGKGRLLVGGLALLQVALSLALLPAFRAADDDATAHYDSYFREAAVAQLARAQTKSISCVATVGIDPAVINLNGFSSFGGYWMIYPAGIKQDSLAITAPEVARSADLTGYVPQSNRAFFFASELRRQHFYLGDTAPAAIDVRYDVAAMRHAGISHVLSISPISNAAELGLEPVATTRSANANLTLYAMRSVLPTGCRYSATPVGARKG